MTIQMKMGGGLAPEPEKPLPLFRQDLEIYPGPNDRDGSPTFNILDPVRAQYFKVSWGEATVMRNLEPGMTLSQLAKKLGRTTTIKVVPEELQKFFEEAVRNHLTVTKLTGSALFEEHEKMRKLGLMKLMTKLLFFRIPLLNPDKFLEAALPVWRLLISKPMIYLYACISVLGFILLFSRIESFLHTFPYFFNMRRSCAAFPL